MKARIPYPSDLTGPRWARVSRFIPAPEEGGRRAKFDRREIVNAPLYAARTGRRRRAMPHDLPPWRITYRHLMRWKKDGAIDRLMDELRGDLRQAEGRRRQPSAAAPDGQSVKTTEKATVLKVKGGRRAIQSPAPHAPSPCRVAMGGRSG